MAHLHIKLLGGFEIQSASGEALAIKGRKSQALLAYRASPPGESRSRDKLTALLWSDRGEQQARSSLRQALTELRKALPDLDQPLLITDRDTVHVDPDAIEVDAVTFEHLINDGTPESLQRAAELYQGEFLDGLGVHDPAFEEWMRDERSRLHECAREAESPCRKKPTALSCVFTQTRAIAPSRLSSIKHAARCCGPSWE
jgi:DNA-binding SARP family transcriptional activator